MSDWSEFCDEMIAELTSTVDGLRDAKTHRYASWDPETLFAPTGERHLAVWPEGGAEHPAAPLTATGGVNLVRDFVVMVWEGAADQDGRLKHDEEATAALLDLENAVRERLFQKSNQRLGSMDEVRPNAVALPDPVTPVRAFAWRVRTFKGVDFK